MPHDILEADPNFMPILARYAQAVKTYPQAKEQWIQQIKKWEDAVSKAKKEGTTPPQRPYMPIPYGPEHPDKPSGLYNSVISTLMPYTIRGVIWYQGETNVPRAYQYRKLFPALIKSWRQNWHQGNFPFYYVQIAPWNYGDSPTSPELREAQLLTLTMPNTGMAVTADIVDDPNDIHPQNKAEVGRRLALWALTRTYGYKKSLIYSGPLYRSMRVEDEKIRLFFDHIGNGLIANGATLTDFTIAGQDRRFVKATAIIEANSVIVCSTDIKNPVAVRYGWSNTPHASLFNKEGLPASPFRTDEWPGITIDQR